MKRKLIISVIIALRLITPVNALGVSAESAVLIDGASGRVLYEKNSNSKMLIASTTKILTGFIIADECNPDDIVTVDRKAVGIEGSSVYLKEGEKLTVRELLCGLLLQSGNDAAAALAIYHSKTIEAFAAHMNKRAAELGMKNSSFANPHGLNADNHYSTAFDMAVLTKHAMDNDLFGSIVSSKTAKVGDISVRNHNKLLWNLPGANGVKTGYTKKAGRCLVSSAERGGRRFIAVTLKAPDDWRDHSAMMEYVFSMYTQRVIFKNDFTLTIPLLSGGGESASFVIEDGIVLSLSDDELARLKTEIMLPQYLWPPVDENCCGTVRVTLDGMTLAERKLLYGKTSKNYSLPWDNVEESG